MGKPVAARRWFGVFVLVAWMSASAESDAAELRVPAQHGTIQAAIHAAQDGDTILVAAGTYPETIRFLGKSIAVVSEEGPDVTVIDAGGSGTTVSFVDGEDRSTRLEGFTVTGGTGSVRVGIPVGGGVLCENSSPTILDCVIRANTAGTGGGLAALLSDVLLVGNRFVDNEAAFPSGTGGGVAVIASSNVEFRDNVFEENQAFFGGGIGLDGTSYVDVAGDSFFGNTADCGGGICLREGGAGRVRDASIEDNEVLFYGGGIYVQYGGLSVESSVLRGNRSGSVGGGLSSFFAGLLLVLECTFDSNQARNSGGGIAADQSRSLVVEHSDFFGNRGGGEGGAIHCVGYRESPQRDRFAHNRIRGNFAGRGAGVSSHGGRIDLLSNEIVGNFAAQEGGGLALYYRHGALITRISSCVIADNVVTGTGGHGGGVFGIGALFEMTNCTIANNEADTGGGFSLASDRPTITNSIIWGNRAETDPQLHDPLGRVPIEYCFVEGGWEGTGNRDEWPGFADCEAGDYRLRMDAACVDAGASISLPETTDFEGDERILDGSLDDVAAVDVGADEVRPETAVLFGSVGAAMRRTVDVLHINGSRGDSRRLVTVERGAPLEISMMAAPGGPSPGRFVLYGWRSRPDRATLSVLPMGLGWLPRANPLAGGSGGLPRVVWNNLGYRAVLGAPTLPSEPAPSLVLDGILANRVDDFTFAGILQDADSAHASGLSVTNGIVLEVR